MKSIPHVLADAEVVAILRDFFHDRVTADRAMQALDATIRDWAAVHARRWHGRDFRKDMQDKAPGDLYQSLLKQKKKGTEPPDWIRWCNKCIQNKIQTSAKRRSKSKSLRQIPEKTTERGPNSRKSPLLDPLEDTEDREIFRAGLMRLKPSDRLLLCVDRWDIVGDLGDTILQEAGITQAGLDTVLAAPEPVYACGQFLGLSEEATRQRRSRAKSLLRQHCGGGG